MAAPSTPAAPSTSRYRKEARRASHRATPELAQPPIAHGHATRAFHGVHGTAATHGDRGGVFGKNPDKFRPGDVQAIDPVHDLRAEVRRRQAGPAGPGATDGLRDKDLLQSDCLIVEAGDLGDAQDLAAAI